MVLLSFHPPVLPRRAMGGRGIPSACPRPPMDQHPFVVFPLVHRFLPCPSCALRIRQPPDSPSGCTGLPPLESPAPSRAPHRHRQTPDYGGHYPRRAGVFPAALALFERAPCIGADASLTPDGSLHTRTAFCSMRHEWRNANTPIPVSRLRNSCQGLQELDGARPLGGRADKPWPLCWLRRLRPRRLKGISRVAPDSQRLKGAIRSRWMTGRANPPNGLA